jgi:hypothetical protein
VIGLVRHTGPSAIPWPVLLLRVGAAAGCDLLIFSVLISVTKIKRSQPAAAPAQVIARAVPGKLLDNGYGVKKASPWLAFVIYGPFQGRTE